MSSLENLQPVKWQHNGRLLRGTQAYPGAYALYPTPFASPQLELIELDEEQWIKFQRRPARHYSRRIAMLPQQLSLIDLGTSALVLLALKVI